MQQIKCEVSWTIFLSFICNTCFLIFLAKAQASLKTLGTISSVLHVDSCTKLVGLDAPRPLDTSTTAVKALAFGNKTQGTCSSQGWGRDSKVGTTVPERPSTRSTEASALPGLFLPAWIASSITWLKGYRMNHIQETVRVHGVLIRPQQSHPGIRRGEKWNNFKHWKASLGSVQFSHSVCLTLCNPKDCSTSGLPVHHKLPEFMSIELVMPPTISPSVVPFSSPLQTFPASGSFQMSHLFTSVVKVLELHLQYQSFQGTPRTDFL